MRVSNATTTVVYVGTLNEKSEYSVPASINNITISTGVIRSNDWVKRNDYKGYAGDIASNVRSKRNRLCPPLRQRGTAKTQLKRSGRNVASIGCLSPLTISSASSSPTINASVAPEWVKATKQPGTCCSSPNTGSPSPGIGL